MTTPVTMGNLLDQNGTTAKLQREFAEHLRTGAPIASLAPAPTEERGVVDAEHPPEGYRLAENGDDLDRQDLLNWIRGEGPWTQTFGGYGYGEMFKAAIHHPVAIPIAPTPTAPDWQDRAEKAEARVEEMRAGIEQALVDMEAGYMPFNTIRALLEGAKP